MNILKPFAFVLLAAAVSCSTSRTKPLSEVELRQRTARVQLGMLRSEVEPLFPRYSEPLTIMDSEGVTRRSTTILDDGAVVYLHGSAQIEVYRVSPEWAVYVQYDYSKPEPKVSGPVTLRRVSK